MTDRQPPNADYGTVTCDWKWECHREAVALRHYRDQRIPVCSVHAGDVSRPSPIDGKEP